MDVIVARCAGLDVHKKTVMAAVRTPEAWWGPREVVREFSTFTDGLVELRDWLVEERVTQVAMEATGSYWKPVWHVLEDAAGFELLLVNPMHVKKVPGRKTDVSDASWLAQLLECGLLARKLHSAGRDRPAAGPDPLSQEADPGTHPRGPAHPEAARGRRHQVALGGQRRGRQVRPGDARGPHRRGARPGGARRNGQDPDALQDPGAAPGVGGPLRGTSRGCWPACISITSISSTSSSGASTLRSIG